MCRGLRIIFTERSGTSEFTCAPLNALKAGLSCIWKSFKFIWIYWSCYYLV